MLYPTYNEFEVAKITGWSDDGRPFFKRGKIVESQKIKELFGYKEVYTSVGRYEKVSEYIASNDGKIRGYNGTVWYDWIIIDIDELTPLGVKTFVEHLKVNYNISLEYITIYFSGNKGFHVYIPSSLFGLSPGTSLHHIIRKIVEKITGGIINYDSSLYDKTQVVRLPYSKHGKSDLFKIPLYFNELDLTIDQIRALAVDYKKRMSEFVKPSYPIVSISGLVDMVKELEKKNMPNEHLPQSKDRIIPQYRKLCIYDMLEGTTSGIQDGTPGRDETAIRIAAHFKKEGYGTEILSGIMHAWNQLNKPPMADNEINSIVLNSLRANYDYGCNDEVHAYYCHTNCFLFKNKNGNKPVVTQ